MKKILVPTDFSDCATYASDLAVRLAEKLMGEVHFYTRLDIHPLWDQLSEKARMDFPESFNRIYEAKLKFQELRKRYEGSNVRIVSSYSHGDLVGVVSRYIDKEDIYMILMGSSGADGVKEFFFGSNAQKIVKHAHAPVMVVKHPAEGEFKNIVFASDFREGAKKSFQQLLEFAQPFHAHIHLLHIEAPLPFGRSDLETEGDIEAFASMCWRLPYTKHDFRDVNIELGITHFANDTHADLVAVSHYGQPKLKRILTGSITEALVNHLEIPILTMNTRELNAWYKINELEISI
ncbi:MAG: universal stress protein [Bacteroidia bacterium]